MGRYIVSRTPQAMKRMNKRLILATIREKQPISRADIAEITLLSRTPVSQLIDELLEEGLVKETGTGVSTSQCGCRPVLLSIVEYAAFVFGIDIGGSQNTTVIWNLFGRIVCKE